MDTDSMYLQIAPQIIPGYPYLLQDIWALGSFPDEIIELLGSLSLPPASRAVELGCGKGAVMLQVAKNMSIPVHGVDPFSAFLDEAKRRCAEMGLVPLCSFSQETAQQFLQRGECFDAAILAGTGPLFPSYDQTISCVRQIIRPGGYIIIDDGYILDAEAPRYPGYEYLDDYSGMVSMLESSGDRLTAQRIIPGEKLRKYNQRNNECIERRCRELVRTNPEYADALDRFTAAEKQECQFMEEQTVAAIWAVQRREDTAI